MGFLRLSVLELGRGKARDRQTDRQTLAPPIITEQSVQWLQLITLLITYAFFVYQNIHLVINHQYLSLPPKKLENAFIDTCVDKSAKITTKIPIIHN